MTITINKYVDITSGIGAGASVAQRDLIARLFSTNPSIPTQTVVEFESLTDVGDYFGTASEEYRRASFYFGFVSKNTTRPKKISFARWASTDVGATILGTKVTSTLAQLQAITAGGFAITLAGVAANVSALDLSGISSFSDAATSLQTAIRAASGTFAQVTVTFNAVENRFEFGSGNTGAETIAIQDGAQTPLALIGWGANARLSDGVVVETVSDVLLSTTDLTNNFGSFAFIPVLSKEQFVEAATWNQAQNIAFQLMVPVTESNAQEMSEALIGYSGVALTLMDVTTNQYPEMLPMMILAATNYNKQNSVQNYMFQQDSRLSPTVATTAQSNQYDNWRVNYYGRTQTAGQFIDFYQRGILCGGSTVPTSMNTYANEQWLKDNFTSRFMSLLLSQARVSANQTGRAQAITVLKAGDELAKFNGTVSVGKTLTENQKIYITEATGDDLAWLQVQNTGSWFSVTFRKDTDQSGTVTDVLVYDYIYAKDDVVRKVEGTHTLI